MFLTSILENINDASNATQRMHHCSKKIYRTPFSALDFVDLDRSLSDFSVFQGNALAMDQLGKNPKIPGIQPRDDLKLKF